MLNSREPVSFVASYLQHGGYAPYACYKGPEDKDEKLCRARVCGGHVFHRLSLYRVSRLYLLGPYILILLYSVYYLLVFISYYY